MSDERGDAPGPGRLVAVVVGVLVLSAPMLRLDPDSPWGIGYQLGIEIVATIVLGIAVLALPVGHRLVWGLLLCSMALTVLGDVVYDYQAYHLGESPFPGLADPIYLASYVPELAVIAVLVRSRHPERDWAQWLDSAIIAAPVAAVVGVFVLVPTATASPAYDLGTLVSLAYPVMDVVVLTGLIRLLVGGGRPSRSLALLTLSVSVTLLADLTYDGLAAAGLVDDTPGWMNALFSLGVLLMAGAALLPDAVDVRTPSPDAGRVISPPRAVALGLGTLGLPVLIALGVRSDVDTGVRLLAAASIVVNMLVVWRAVLLLGIVQRQREDLARVARTDSLTGLPNRRSWDFEVGRAVAHARGSGTSLAVAMIDLDGFKPFNDRFGHQAGDQLLAECAHGWTAVLPPQGYLARYGGDEFSLLLPEIGPDEVRATLERLRLATPDGVTVSIGYALHDHVDDDVQTVADADAALYAAKHRGRNITVSLDTVEPAVG